ncbi:phosphodiester glycosidase family protein [Sporomusa sp.]|uniref:phosphodiester glycosidase family protein n=1 Tax=Sporomusa sp. TaxID=2078658 RepID=UPI002BE1CB1E|nr:phosphodiester glycosidase family protein [Sporomusa sp.]HWR44352.1 phosphodiester glycosidase family protein [Sporomusa sp.]
MFNHLRLRMSLITACMLLIMLLLQSAAWAAPNAVVSKIRTSQNVETVRIVFDVSALPEYTVTTIENPLRLVIDMPGAVNKAAAQYVFNDPTVGKLRLAEAEPGKLRAVLDMKTAYMYKVFTLKNPNRLVVDIIKNYEQKLVEEPAPGIKYTSWLRNSASGPVWAHILDVDPKAGFAIKPVLSNGAIQGLEPLLPMVERSRAIAAVNGSYFGLDGSIIGLLKIDGEIASTPEVPRTALGIMPDGKLFIDQVHYEGKIELPDTRTVPINAVNRERGENELVLYNGLYAPATGSNNFGIEYVVVNGKVTAVNTSNSPIPSDGFVLSAHGAAARLISCLKVGDSVKVNQTLGPEWDKTQHALGAGPMLVKNNSVFLTTKIEEFGSDVAGGRAPRTALGLKADGNILVVVVDGRHENSIGMTLLELALFMQELGAQDAMNLDGGGSSEMVLNGKIVNKPSDGRERRVGDALAIMLPRVAN